MSIYEFADIINCEIDIKYYPNQKGRFSCSFKNSEIKEGPILRSAYGSGKTINESINYYIDCIIGKTLVINATGSNRQEFVIPSIDKE